MMSVIVGSFVVTEVRIRRSGYRASQQPPRPPSVEHDFHGEHVVSVRGGVRIGWMNATWPLASLTVDQECAVIRSSLIGRVHVRRDDVRLVQVVRAPLGSGIRFVTDAGSFDGVIFWTFSVARVASMLAGLGWPMNGVQADSGDR